MNLSTFFLLTSNLIVIILAIVQEWEVSTVLWVYWMQSVIIGFFQFAKILSLKNFSTENFKIANQPVQPTQKTKLITAFFFLFHYGFFHLLYAIFLFSFFTNQQLDLMFIFTGGLIFFINNLFSYFYNKTIEVQKQQNIGHLMFAPYARIIPMHLIIVFGAFLGQSALIVFLFIKTFVDLLMHNLKRNVNYSINLWKFKS